MKKLELSISDLKTRDKIISALSTIDLLSRYTRIEGELKLNSKDFAFTGRMSEFDMILNSIYEYERVINKWHFKFNNIIIKFSLS